MPQAKKKAAKKAAEPPKEAEAPEPENTEEAEETDEQRDAAGAARKERVLTPGLKGKEEVPEYEPQREDLEHTDFDHHGAEEDRQAELQAQREEHNRRTGDASL